MSRKRKKGRRVNGVLLLDKPSDITSNRALQRVRAMYQAQKGGHTGALDPLATGMLPLCFGEATKFAQYLLNADKTYEVVAKLGETTETGDAEGEIVEKKAVPTVSFSQIEDILQRFLGETEQIPSMYSALKHNGTPLYKLARQGIEVEREPRKITIFDISDIQLRGLDENPEVDEPTLEPTLSFTVHCSKGTYVRSLVEDVGALLGCGAHVKSLRRLSVGRFPAEKMVSIEHVQSLVDNKAFAELEELLLPVQSCMADWPQVILNETEAYYLKTGLKVTVDKATPLGFVSVMQQTESDVSFVGVAEVLEGGLMAPRRLVSTEEQFS